MTPWGEVIHPVLGIDVPALVAERDRLAAQLAEERRVVDDALRDAVSRLSEMAAGQMRSGAGETARAATRGLVVVRAAQHRVAAARRHTHEQEHP